MYLGPAHDDVVLSLDSKNFVKGNLPDRSIVILLDSGATRTILSQDAISKSPYLASIEQQTIEPVTFRLGNGAYICGSKSLTFQISIQGHKFQVTSIVAPGLVGLDLILGTPTMKSLNGVLDFGSNTFRLKTRKVYFKPVVRTVIFPGQTRYVNVRTSLPTVFKNSDILAYPTRKFNAFCPSNMLLNLRSNRTRILVTNHSRKPIVIRTTCAVAYAVTTKDHVAFVQDIPTQGCSVQNKESLHSIHTTEFVDSTEACNDIRSFNLKKYPHLKEN